MTVLRMNDLYNPILQALRNLDGSGTNKEISSEVIKVMNLTDEQRAVLKDRISWVKANLKRAGLLENPRRAVWALTEEGRNTAEVDPRKLARTVQQMIKEERAQERKEQQENDTLPDNRKPPEKALPLVDAQDLIASLSGWRDELSGLLHGMSPPAFERFFLRIFRKDGIEAVDVTGRSGDDMIEGMMESGGFLSLRVSFRCIRGSRLISTDEVQDFRRAVEVGGAHKGALVTTGSFTQEAVREAGRGGASDIDLIDGEQLIDKLKELSLGVKTERVVVERVMIDADWFQSI